MGVNDETHEVVGTSFNADRDINNEPLKHYLARQCSPSINFTFKDLKIEGKRIVLLTIPAAKSVPTSYARERYMDGMTQAEKENIIATIAGKNAVSGLINRLFLASAFCVSV